MLRFLILAFFSVACSIGGIKSGGEAPYLYDHTKTYSSSELRDLSSKVIESSLREPPFGRLEKLFGPGQKPLKKIGIVVFESEIQPTRSGLSGPNLIYLNEAGKQLLTDGMYRTWADAFGILSPEIEVISKAILKKSQAFRSYGSKEKDYILSNRKALAPDDIFFLKIGKTTTTKTIMNPRGMQDVSFLLVPGHELMRGPKFSEHNKHFINDLSRELGLDALIIVKSDLSWSVAHDDKHSGESVPDAILINLESSILIPFHSYHERLKKSGSTEESRVSICLRSYQGRLQLPISLSKLEDEQTYAMIENRLLLPMMKSYTDLTQMMIVQISTDLKKTW